MIERDRHCVFPYAAEGPPGQTSPEKLACLCRRRCARDGTIVWTSPMGRIYLVTSDGAPHFTGFAA